MNPAPAIAIRIVPDAGMEAFHSGTTSRMPYDAMEGRAFADEIDRLGFTQVGFADWLGVGRRTIRDYVQKGAPQSVVTVVELLKRVHVPEAPSPIATTLEKARDAIQPAARALLDDAASKHWPKAMLADVLTELAAQLRAEAEAEPTEEEISLKL